ncbi:response regulator [Moraxella equi]|uniref:DNA-binding response regulator n=1 Tax=Moraxella equi TaxID=60442 RepID=A0A378QX74_9GAMM|nr:response regulator [Moraxella equi]OPH38826.1 DNA-binding response regulator [Moraxella equi]STZ04043.1 Transcriptional regulatory protein CreB [Moraxella equi]
MHILIIEDDPAIATTLRFALEREGYTVSWADTVAKVAPCLDTPRLDAVVLDVGLPDGDGFGVCQMIRQGDRHAHAPILFLTARTDEIDRILGLELGADDYIAKPFSPRELIARLKAIWRRENIFTQKSDKTDISGKSDSAHTDFTKITGIHTWHYQACDYSLFLNNHALTLSKTELGIMLTLLANPTHILSREQILASISDHPEHRLSRTIDSHIKTLRQKLSTVCDDELIVTHRGLRYSLC